MNKLPGLPVADHCLFPGYYNKYVKLKNSISDRLELAGLTELSDDLEKLIYAAQDIERLSFCKTLSF